MTYTFKLARRLAVSRNFSMLPVLLLFAACGDATAPEGSPSDSPTAGTEWRPRDITPVAVRVSPGDVTLETNQLIHFRAHGRTSAGDSVGALVTWSTTGGTILPDGRFSAAAIGTYRVIGRSRVRDRLQEDTSTVVVVRRQPQLSSIEVTPGSASLIPATSQTFTAVGRHLNGSPVAIGVNWTSTGGVIDDGGTYVAGDTAGTYHVVASNTAGTIADTAIITISAPPSPPPPPTPAPPPAPVLERLTLVPSSVTLAPSTTKQFAVYGRTTAGDSVPVTVEYAATGGTVTPGGLFTAGPTAGTFRIIATSGTLADTSTITVRVPLGGGTPFGMAFGPWHVPLDSLGKPGFAYTGGTLNGTAPILKADLDKVRAAGGRVVLGLLRRQTKDAAGRLSVAATKAYLDTWPDISPYLADGTVVGIMVADDVCSSCGHLWGGEAPPRARIDSLALLVKTRWPQAVAMLRLKPTQLTGYNWRWLDAAWAQYNGPFRDGSPEKYRDAQVATAKALGLSLVLGLNALDSGCGPVSLGACLPDAPGTDILGSTADAARLRRYQPSAAEVLRYGTVFLNEPYNCAMLNWQWSPIFSASEGRTAEQLAGVRAFDTRPDIREVMAKLGALARQRGPTSCKRP